MKRRPFLQGKPSQAGMYLWTPKENEFQRTTNENNSKGNTNNFYCNAISGTQGEDWITTYGYDLLIIDGVKHRIAYVECGYVE